MLLQDLLATFSLHSWIGSRKDAGDSDRFSSWHQTCLRHKGLLNNPSFGSGPAEAHHLRHERRADEAESEQQEGPSHRLASWCPIFYANKTTQGLDRQ